MLTDRTLGDYVAAEPFRPFCIKTARDQSFEIRHPEMILVGRTTAKIYMSSDGDEARPERWHDVSMLLMESVELLPTTTSANR